MFLLNLRDAGIDFVAVDMPGANRMMIGIMALVAEQEREAKPAHQGRSGGCKGPWRASRQSPAGEDGALPYPQGGRLSQASRAVPARRSSAEEFAELIQPLFEGDLAGLSANAAAART